jgi:hypothetical protein
MALIGEDCSISLRLGSVAAGVITWVAFGTITAKARRISAEDSCELANTKAIGDPRKKFRGHSGSTRIDLEEVVGYGGYAFLTGRVTPIGAAAELTIKEISSLSTGSVFTGIVEKWKGDIQSTEVQIESMSIMCDIDAA